MLVLFLWSRSQSRCQWWQVWPRSRNSPIFLALSFVSSTYFSARQSATASPWYWPQHSQRLWRLSCTSSAWSCCRCQRGSVQCSDLLSILGQHVLAHHLLSAAVLLASAGEVIPRVAVGPGTASSQLRHVFDDSQGKVVQHLVPIKRGKEFVLLHLTPVLGLLVLHPDALVTLLNLMFLTMMLLRTTTAGK